MDFGVFWRENDDQGQTVKEDQEPDQVRPDVHSLVVKPKPAETNYIDIIDLLKYCTYI